MKERSERLMELFESLVLVEKRLDQTITQKKMAVEEAHFKKIKKICTVRINISLEKTSENSLFILIGGKVKEEPQPGDSAESNTETKSIGSVVSKLYVELSENPESSTSEGSNSATQEAHRDGSSGAISKRVKMTTNDRSETFFEWHNRAPPSDVSEFEIKTTAKSSHGKLFISFISYTGIFELCDDLAQPIGIKKGTKPAILLGIWKYITAQKMRDPARPKVIVCNDIFKQIFQKDEMVFTEIIQGLNQLLSPIDMISFDFPIPTQPGSKSQCSYDITAELDPITREYAYANNNKISILNKKIEDIQLRIEKQNEKIDGLRRFTESPKEYITNWILDSSKDLHLIADDLFDVNDGFYAQKEIQESVYQLLQNYK
ncbi:SWI/SNF-related matrix-associated actin-dependent regulator of chromatin subfamily D [Nematocida sp. AWRm78]|nr:SWI/SNF-related matrix-associated actin-dependent regulator of chromatin subfamily D [Nematocida sp. AWRm79]KAI5183963.1 SWI/SNF-related matrix-associated actin-dependent regulator of chromatin subfamily D [Nematocida sp. AWRm78]